MSSYTVTILQRKYNISCSDNEVSHVQKCADLVNKTLNEVMQSYKTGSETTIMTMTLLTMADELIDLKAKQKTYAQQENNSPAHTEFSIPEAIFLRIEELSNKMHKTNEKLL